MLGVLKISGWSSTPRAEIWRRALIQLTLFERHAAFGRYSKSAFPCLRSSEEGSQFRGSSCNFRQVASSFVCPLPRTRSQARWLVMSPVGISVAQAAPLPEALRWIPPLFRRLRSGLTQSEAPQRGKWWFGSRLPLRNCSISLAGPELGSEP